LDVPKNDTLFIYIFTGSGLFSSQVIHAKNAILFNKGTSFEVTAQEEGIRFILLTAPPLHEPIAWGGPVVMNTREELQQAFHEINNGTFTK